MEDETPEERFRKSIKMNYRLAKKRVEHKKFLDYMMAGELKGIKDLAEKSTGAKSSKDLEEEIAETRVKYSQLFSRVMEMEKEKLLANPGLLDIDEPDGEGMRCVSDTMIGPFKSRIEREIMITLCYTKEMGSYLSQEGHSKSLYKYPGIEQVDN